MTGTSLVWEWQLILSERWTVCTRFFANLSMLHCFVTFYVLISSGLFIHWRQIRWLSHIKTLLLSVFLDVAHRKHVSESLSESVGHMRPGNDSLLQAVKVLVTCIYLLHCSLRLWLAVCFYHPTCLETIDSAGAKGGSVLRTTRRITTTDCLVYITLAVEAR